MCVSPYFKKDIGINLPCGKCFKCLKKRHSEWGIRLMQEYERSSRAYFITLTYDPQHVPITEKGFMTTQISHISQFMKQLRKLNEEKLKYYAVSEYGSKTQRPHYHIILFNVDIETVPMVWNKGDIHVGELNIKTVSYALKYIQKQHKIGKYDWDDREPEKARMSKKLGDNYIKTYKKWHHKDKMNRYYVSFEGLKCSLPRYYKEKLYTKSLRMRIGKYQQIQQQNEINQMTMEKNYQQWAEKIKIEIENSRKFERNKNKTDKL